MLTIKAEVLKKDLRVDGTYNVKIRFTYKREVKRLSTSLFAKSTDLVKKNLKIKEGTHLKREVDKLVAHYQELCATMQIDVNNYTLKEIITGLESEQRRQEKIDFIQFSREWISKATIKGAPNYTTALNAFVAFIGQEELDIAGLTIKLLNAFAKHILTSKEKRNKQLIAQGKRPTSNRAVSLYLGSLRHLFNEAQRFYNDYDRDIILIPRSPFENFKIPRQEATRKRAITPQQIRAIFELPYQNRGKGTKGTCRFDIAKDCFIMSFCLMGMNSADLYNCSIMEDEVITYYRTKTKDRRHDKAKMMVKVLPIIRPIMEKYKDKTGNRLFNFYHYYSTSDGFNKAINIGLKQIGEVLDIEDLEYYAARHSWATIAVNQVRIDKYTVHSALNHLDETMRVTDIYIERDFVNENKANAKVVKYVFGK